MERSPLSSKPSTVLLVSAQASDYAGLMRILLRPNWNLSVRTTWREALDFLRMHAVPVVICDAESDVTNWRRILLEAADLPETPCVIVSSRLADERLWAEVLNRGGHDVLCTPFDPEEVLRVTFLALQFWQGERLRSRALTGVA